jgi:hypothetical protein
MENKILKLPLEYRWLKANGFNGFVPWSLIDNPGSETLRREYQTETGEDFYPFASRQDCDDVAGFVVVDGEIQNLVVVAHLTWSRSREIVGFPSRIRFKNMFDWLKNQVMQDTWEWMSEEDLKDVEEH